jgi:signal transduction histidine kinase
MEQPGQILVVDDEPGIREVCQRTLVAAGHSVETAASGDEALVRLEKGAFDVVLTDISMPGVIDGPRLLEAIKRKWPTVDVIMMTSFPTLETAIPTLKTGAYDYLIKPFDQQFVISVVFRCLEKRRLSKELNREKTLREELEAAYVELQKVEELKEAFLGRLSHELRTPFISVFYALDEILTKPSEPANPSTVEKLRAGVSRAWEIVENLLLFADLKRNTSESNRLMIDLRTLLESLIKKYQSQWESKGLTVDLSLDENIPRIEALPELLETAFKHLLLNAIYFNKKGGRILIQAKVERSEIKISFSDTGIGIPKDKTSRIFDSFYQVAEYLTREVGGLGLGLAIVRRIIEAHGGLISVHSRDGGGSEFRVSLPQSPPSLAPSGADLKGVSHE